MRLAVFSDIHGNLEALRSFIDDASSRNIHRYICLGDIVGYGADPEACITLVQSLPKINFLLGNHDACAVWRSSPYSLGKKAQKSIFWTMGKMSKDSINFLKNIKPVISIGEMIFSHANPYSPEGWSYIINKKHALYSFRSVSEKCIVVGHSHSPLVINRHNFFHYKFHYPQGSYVIPIEPKKRQIVNCGSVGQPRDSINQGCYCVIDTRKMELEFYRFSYDIAAAAAKIRAAGLPMRFADRLLKGR